jgi:hypothetical protein
MLIREWRMVGLQPTTSVETFRAVVDRHHRARYEAAIQWDESLPDSLLEAVAAVVDEFPETQVRVYASESTPEWLAGLEAVRHLCFEAWKATSFAELGRFRELRSLKLGSTSSRRPSLEFLAELPRLTELVVDGQSRDVEAAAQCTGLKQLYLHSVRDAQWLRRMGASEALEVLAFHGGTIPDLTALSDFPNLMHLSLTFVKRLGHDALAPIGECQQLTDLSLMNLPSVTRLPFLAHGPAQTLRRLTLSDMRNLETLEDLLALRQLVWLQVGGARPVGPPDKGHPGLPCLAEIDSLQHLGVWDRYPDGEVEALVAAYRGRTLIYRNAMLVGAWADRTADLEDELEIDIGHMASMRLTDSVEKRAPIERKQPA